MNTNGLSTIRQRYIKNELLAAIAKQFAVTNNIIHSQLIGACGAEAAFVVFALQQWSKKSILIICTDKENAAHQHNDIETVFEQKNNLLLLDSYRNAFQFSKLNKNAVSQRTEIIQQLINFGHRPQIIISYPEAILEKVVSPSELKQTAFSSIASG